MSAPDDAQQCDFCKRGRVITRKHQLAFRQWTERGYVHCRAEVPIGLCDRCGSKHWNKEAEAIVEEVVTKSCCVETPFRPTATLTRSGNDGSSRFPTIFEAGPARAGFAPVNGMTARAELTRGCHTAGTQ